MSWNRTASSEGSAGSAAPGPQPLPWGPAKLDVKSPYPTMTALLSGPLLSSRCLLEEPHFAAPVLHSMLLTPTRASRFGGVLAIRELCSEPLPTPHSTPGVSQEHHGCPHPEVPFAINSPIFNSWCWCHTGASPLFWLKVEYFSLESKGNNKAPHIEPFATPRLAILVPTLSVGFQPRAPPCRTIKNI